eukprot:Seg298.12 transcript_id=Seg298.12/GoldUCD/mRNA.D3Y31 product="putative transferase CAF17-like mitochondrial" protein_id=Seg298.12/GoldUCD/D3Y31
MRSFVRHLQGFLQRRAIFCKQYRQVTRSNATLPRLAKLKERKLIRLNGKDTTKFLQGIITNDMTSFQNDACKILFTMLLNSQGRVLFDAFLYAVPGEPDGYFLECDSDAIESVIKHLKMYKLRAKVNISDASKEVEAWVLFPGNGALDANVMKGDDKLLANKDPRIASLGMRIIMPWNQSPADLLDIDDHIPVDSAVYREHRHKLGIAEGTDEIPPGNVLPLEYNLALINGVSFSKGCYIGQELTARTHHVGQIRKRIMPIQLKQEEVQITDFPQFAPQTPIKTNTGKSAGRVCILSGEYGLGLIRLKEAFESENLLIPDLNGVERSMVACRPHWWGDDV